MLKKVKKVAQTAWFLAGLGMEIAVMGIKAKWENRR
jgi:hypothetical protein